MKIYLAYKDTQTMKEGFYENCVGVFDTEEKAWEFLRTTSDFDRSEPYVNGKSRVYHYDGELSYYWQVTEQELNVPFRETD